jgi:hypothetical protein
VNELFYPGGLTGIVVAGAILLHRLLPHAVDSGEGTSAV